jgi:8-oxo-dGTP pyrophosphatase MutT (NUDIX family)
VPGAEQAASSMTAQIRANLARFGPKTAVAPPGARHAAVSVTMYAHRGQPCVLVLKRIARGRNAGQWALPGGRLDDGETP